MLGNHKGRDTWAGHLKDSLQRTSSLALDLSDRGHFCFSGKNVMQHFGASEKMRCLHLQPSRLCCQLLGQKVLEPMKEIPPSRLPAGQGQAWTGQSQWVQVVAETGSPSASGRAFSLVSQLPQELPAWTARVCEGQAWKQVI